MAVDSIDNEVPERRYATKARTIRVSKPEEGDSSGELLHLIRSLVIVIAFVALIGWLVT